MDERQNRIILEMLREIDEYLKKGIPFVKFVALLEGLFEAAEIKEKSLIDGWYAHWTPLESANGFYAGTGTEPPLSEIKRDLDKFKKFLASITQPKQA